MLTARLLEGRKFSATRGAGHHAARAGLPVSGVSHFECRAASPNPPRGYPMPSPRPQPQCPQLARSRRKGLEGLLRDLTPTGPKAGRNPAAQRATDWSSPIRYAAMLARGRHSKIGNGESTQTLGASPGHSIWRPSATPWLCGSAGQGGTHSSIDARWSSGGISPESSVTWAQQLRQKSESHSIG